jgi:PmbA protein
MEILEFCVRELQGLEVDKFELFWERSSSLGIEIKEGKLDHLSRSTDQGLAIRLLKQQRLGFSYTFDLSKDALRRSLRTATEIADLMPADPYNDLCAVGGQKGEGGFSSVLYPEIENFDAKGLETSLDAKVELARAIESKANAYDSRIKRVRNASYDETAWEGIMVDHHGEQIKHRQTVFGGSISCVAEEGSSAEMGYDSYYSTDFDQIHAESIAQTAAANAVRLLNAGTAPTMTCPAVFENSVVAQLLGFLASSFSAENIDKKFSILVGKKGEKLFSDKLTLIDDGLLAGGVVTAPFDGEGRPSQTTTLLDHGMVRNFLYDGYYARKHGTVSTSSSRRGSLKTVPSIGPSNLYLKKGSLSEEKLIAKAGKGIFITDLMGLHTANPVTGEFSVGASGVLIEGGKLTRPVKGFAIAGNLVDLLQQVSEVGSNIRFWGSVGAPSLLVAKLAVSGA